MANMFAHQQASSASGHWLIVDDLPRCYREIAIQEGWPEMRWAEIGCELAKLTKRKTVKRHGKRHVACLLR